MAASLQIDYVHANSSFLGWIVAAYSFGQLVASPLFGLCADYMPTMVPLVVSLLISIVFNVFYCYAGAFGPGSAGWVLVVTRALIGFGAGELSEGRGGGNKGCFRIRAIVRAWTL